MKKKCKHEEYEIREEWSKNGIKSVSARCSKCGKYNAELSKLFFDRAEKLVKINKYKVPFYIPQRKT